MKKLFRIGLLTLCLMGVLTIPAFAVGSGVAETETSSTSWTYTATLDGTDADTPTTISGGDMYLLIVIKTASLDDGGFPASLTADDILYIDQRTATADDVSSNTIVFSNFTPLNYTGGTAFVTGGSLTAPLAIGTLENHGVLGDANSDQRVNVADITAIRDHILERTALTGTGLAMADVNDDSSVNVADITKIRDYILERITSLS
jgi:hypothetical protein